MAAEAAPPCISFLATGNETANVAAPTPNSAAPPSTIAQSGKPAALEAADPRGGVGEVTEPGVRPAQSGQAAMPSGSGRWQLLQVLALTVLCMDGRNAAPVHW